MSLPRYIDNACDEIDAALFTGDEFHDHDKLMELEGYLDRWQREVTHLKEFIRELEDEIDES